MVSYKQLGYHPRDSALAIYEQEVDPAKLGATEVLVKVSAAALNPVDVVLFNSRLVHFFRSSLMGFGRDFSGVVESVGSEVSKFSKGDKISGIYEPIYGAHGTFSEYLVIDTKRDVNVGKIPQNLSMVESAAFPLVAGTAYTSLTHFKKPQDCERVLVIGGATSVGGFVIQLLKKVHDVQTVVSVCSNRSSDSVKALGTDIVIDYTRGDVTKEVSALVKDIGKFDLIIDCVGSSDIFPVISDVLKPKAENSGYVTIVGDKVADYSRSALTFFSWALIKRLIFGTPYNYKFSSIAHGGWYEGIVGLFEAGTLTLGLDSVFEGLENYQKAIDKIIDHKAHGKIVLKISDEE